MVCLQRKPSGRAPETGTSFHYGWIIALTGTAVLFSCPGLGRFSLGMLLPSMGTSLHLNYSQMGLIGTGNFVGYMISVALAGMFARTIGARRTIVGGLSIASGPLFGWLSDRLGRKIGMMTVYTLFTVAYALVAANLPNIFLYASIGIFGLAVWSIPTIMSAAVGDYMGPARAVGETMDSPLKPGSWFQYDLSSSRSIHIWNTFD